jgi:hypothetical protein
MGLYSEGSWVKYRHHEGWATKGVVLERRPDDRLVIGDHSNDDNPTFVSPDAVIGFVDE